MLKAFLDHFVSCCIGQGVGGGVIQRLNTHTSIQGQGKESQVFKIFKPDTQQKENNEGKLLGKPKADHNNK